MKKENNKFYKEWLDKSPVIVKKELQKMTDRKVEKYFYSQPVFGTAGIRGEMELGPNGMNEFVLSAAVWSFGMYLLKINKEKAIKKGVAIAHDNRKNNILFSKVAALVLGGLGIKTYFYNNNKLQPTPLLSYTIIKKSLAGGINITASHNPPEYNGIKVYGDDGKQLGNKETDIVKKYFEKIDNIFTIKKSSKLINYFPDTIVKSYIGSIMNLIPFNKRVRRSSLKVVFTAQHGTATHIAKELMTKLKVDFKMVKEQCKEDPNFSNTESPNPENPRAFTLAQKYGDKFDSDILFSTDPDADRFAVMIKHNGKWVHLHGNILPVLQVDYKIKSLNDISYLDDKKSFIIRSIVSSNFVDKIAKKHKIKVYKSLTGFKNIMEYANKYETPDNEMLFAFEESFGSTVRSFTKDKDSFQALVQVIELAHELKKQGKTLLDRYEELSQEYGYHEYEQVQLKFKGPKGFDDAKKYLEKFRKLKEGKKLSYNEITEVIDFSKGYKRLAKEDFIGIIMGDSSIYIRPSGTEPILRFYIYSYSKDKEKAKTMLIKLSNYVKKNKTGK